MIKTNGAEYKAFCNSNWDLFLKREGCYLDDCDIKVNGADYDGDELAIPDNAIVRINTGVVLGGDHKEVCDYQSFFRKWKKAQTFNTFVVQIPKVDYYYFLGQVNLLKGKVL